MWVCAFPMASCATRVRRQTALGKVKIVHSAFATHIACTGMEIRTRTGVGFSQCCLHLMAKRLMRALSSDKSLFIRHRTRFRFGLCVSCEYALLVVRFPIVHKHLPIPRFTAGCWAICSHARLGVGCGNEQGLRIRRRSSASSCTREFSWISSVERGAMLPSCCSILTIFV